MQPPDTLPPSWQRLLALSGVVFGVLFVVGWFASGGSLSHSADRLVPPACIIAADEHLERIPEREVG